MCEQIISSGAVAEQPQGLLLLGEPRERHVERNAYDKRGGELQWADGGLGQDNGIVTFIAVRTIRLFFLW